jgi:tetratricopeptide (TPR) repeat protein
MSESYREAFSKPFFSAVLAGLVIAGASASSAAPAPEAAKYAVCVTKAPEAPEAALDMATAWRAGGGGVAAQHCVALALMGLGKYAEAGKRLEEVAEELQTGHGAAGMTAADNSRLLPEVYGQAGNAWLLAGDFTRAYNILSAGLAETPPWSPLQADLLLDRARALAAMGQNDKALVDLDTARASAPRRADLRVFRAATLRALNRLTEAAADITAALNLEPDNPGALLERGNIYLALGDKGQAQANWTKVMAAYPDTPEAEAARKNLGLLQVDGPANPPPEATHP